MKGIILAGGTGSRLYPLTHVVNKHLLPVYDKPMVYYPLSVLMLAGIREILIISSPSDLPQFQALLGDGADWGLSFEYAVQPTAGGIPQAFEIGRDFIGDSPVCLILGDNVFYGHGLMETLTRTVQEYDQGWVGGTIFGYHVRDPRRYGVAAFDAEGRLVDVVEKPEIPPSQLAITGLYFYDSSVTSRLDNLPENHKGESQVTDLNRNYLQQDQLRIISLGRGLGWFDVGTHRALQEAGSFIFAVQDRQSLQIACPEEIAYRRGYIDEAQLRALAKPLEHNDYGQYLLELLA